MTADLIQAVLWGLMVVGVGIFGLVMAVKDASVSLSIFMGVLILIGLSAVALAVVMDHRSVDLVILDTDPETLTWVAPRQGEVATGHELRVTALPAGKFYYLDYNNVGTGSIVLAASEHEVHCPVPAPRTKTRTQQNVLVFRACSPGFTTIRVRALLRDWERTYLVRILPAAVD